MVDRVPWGDQDLDSGHSFYCPQGFWASFPALGANHPPSKGLSCWTGLCCCGPESWPILGVGSWGREGSGWTESRLAGDEGLHWPSFLTSVSLPLLYSLCLLKPKSNMALFLQTLQWLPIFLRIKPKLFTCCGGPCVDWPLPVTHHWPQLRFQPAFCSRHRSFSLLQAFAHAVPLTWYTFPSLFYLIPSPLFFTRMTILLFLFVSKYLFLQEAFLFPCSEPP